MLDISYLKSNEFKTLIDKGANNGEHDEFLKNLFNIKRVLAFEPQNDKPAVLTAKRFDINELEDSRIATTHYTKSDSLAIYYFTSECKCPKNLISAKRLFDSEKAN